MTEGSLGNVFHHWLWKFSFVMDEILDRSGLHFIFAMTPCDGEYLIQFSSPAIRYFFPFWLPVVPHEAVAEVSE